MIFFNFFAFKPNFVFYLILPFLISSCQITRSVDSKRAIENLCFQTNISEHYYTIDETLNINEVMQDTLLTNRFSAKSLRVATVGGLIPLIRQYLEEKGTNDADTLQRRLNNIAIQQDIQQRINLISLDVESILAEIECERNQLQGIINTVASHYTNKSQILTLGALGASSITSITAITLSFFTASPSISLITLAGSITSAGLSFLTYRYQSLTNLQHEYNFLTDLWVKPEESNLFPPFVWKMLHLESSSIEAPNARPIDILLEGWYEADYFAEAETNEEKEQVAQIIFGKGGTYNLALLSAREQMLNQLQAAIYLMQQDINILNREIHLQ